MQDHGHKNVHVAFPGQRDNNPYTEHPTVEAPLTPHVPYPNEQPKQYVVETKETTTHVQNRRTPSKKRNMKWLLLPLLLIPLIIGTILAILFLPRLFGNNEAVPVNSTTNANFVDNDRERMRQDINPNQNEVFQAVQRNDTRQLKALIDRNANLSTRDQDGNTLLNIASQTGNTDIARLLIEKQPSLVNVAGKNNLYPVHYASTYGNCDLLNYLLQSGADSNSIADSYINEQGQNSVSALHMASKFGKLECVKHLLQRGANVAAKDNFGVTPLETARVSRRNDIVDYLTTFTRT